MKFSFNRQKRLTALSICLISLLLLVSSCGKEESTILKNYKQGYGNLAISLMENFPPKVVYPNSDFKIAVKIDNQGAYQLTNGKLKILGFDDRYISLSDDYKDISSLEGFFYLEGKSVINPYGEFTFVEFEGNIKTLFPGSEEYSAPYIIRADYDYRNEFSQTVCINSQVYDVYESGCKADSQKTFSGQGSPLAVTELEEIIHTGPLPEVEFRFKIENKGKGKVKQVKLEKAALGKEPLICYFRNNPNPDKSTAYFKEEQEITLICQKSLTKQSSYQTTLSLDLSFKYSLEEKETLTVKK